MTPLISHGLTEGRTEGTYAAEVGAASSGFQHITPFSYSILVSRFAVLGNVAVAAAPWGNILLL